VYLPSADCEFLDIYKLVLSSSTPLHLQSPQAPRQIVSYSWKVGALGVCAPVKRYIEFNKLKYVNKQVYSETAGLEFKYNSFKIELGRQVTVTAAGLLRLRRIGYTHISFNTGALEDVGKSASSQGGRLEILWQHAKNLWEETYGDPVQGSSSSP
jgi:hypothetical protein